MSNPTADHQFAIGEIAVICNMPEPVARWNGEELAITGPCEFRKWKLITDKSIHREGLAYKGKLSTGKEVCIRPEHLRKRRPPQDWMKLCRLDQVPQKGVPA